MRRLVILLMVVLVAALPLRGAAAFAGDPCGDHHGTPAAAAADGHGAHGCDHAADGAPVPLHADHGQDTGNAADSCAHCVACVAGCGLVASTPMLHSGLAPGLDRIPFRPAYAGGHFPALPDRPPLAS